MVSLLMPASEGDVRILKFILFKCQVDFVGQTMCYGEPLKLIYRIYSTFHDFKYMGSLLDAN